MKDEILIGLKIMGMGMGGIFLAIGIIIIAVLVLNAVSRKGNQPKN